MTGYSNKYTNANKHNLVLAASGSQEGEGELWFSLRSGSREALNAIFEKYGRGLFSYGRNMTSDHCLISDCMQDVFVELWARRETVAVEVHSINAYLIKSLRRRIAKRLSENMRFAGKNLPKEFFEEVEFNIEVNIVRDQTSRERSIQLKASIATLSKRQQEVLYLKFHENMDYDDIAAVMNTNVKAAYNLVSRSIACLRKFFEVHPMASD